MKVQKEKGVNYYAIIPANVRYDNDLPPNAKLMYGEITALCNQKGFCWSTNEYFSGLYNVKPETVSRWISKLKSKGHINTEMTKTKYGSERKIFIGDPLDKKIKTPHKPTRQKSQDPLDKKVKTPLDKKVKHNNTVVNNTSEYYNSTTTTTGAKDFEKKQKPENPVVGDHPLKSDPKEEKVAAVDVATSEPTEKEKVEAIVAALNSPGSIHTEGARKICQDKKLDFATQSHDYAMSVFQQFKFPLSEYDKSELRKRFWQSMNGRRVQEFKSKITYGKPKTEVSEFGVEFIPKYNYGT